MSHAHAARSTWQWRLVAHFTAPSPSSGHLGELRELLDSRFGDRALRRRKEVARPDDPDRAAKPRERPPPHAVVRALGRTRGVRHRPIVRGDSLRHAIDERPLFCRRRGPSGPDARRSAGLLDRFGEPFELFARAPVERQGDETVDQLRDAETTQPPPESDPRRRWLARKPVGEENPTPRGVDHGCMVRNLGCATCELQDRGVELGRVRGPQSLYGSCTSRPAIATPSGRSVCFTRTVSPCAASTSGRRLYTSGASSAPPPTTTMPCSRRRACTARQSTRPGLTCSCTQTFITPASGWSGQTPFFGTPAVELTPSMSKTRSQSRFRQAYRFRRRIRPAACERLITRPAPWTVE